MWKLVHLQQLVQSTEVGVASRREWSTPSNTRGDSAVSQQEVGGGGPGPITQQLQINPSPVAALSNPWVEFFTPLPPPPHRKHPTSLCSAIVSRTGGEGLVGMRRQGQQDCPSYLVEEVRGRSLLGSSPALHHLDDLRYHTHRGGEGHQEQQV